MKLTESQNEVWKPIPEYEEHYLVSNLGRIKSIKFGKEKILKGKITGDYVEIDLRKPGYLVRTVRVHRLVAELFLDNPNEYPVVNHKDGDKHNNMASNLEWCDYSHNNREAYRLGLNKTRPIIQKDIEGNIIKRWGSVKEASEALNISGSNISKCARGQVNTSGGYTWEYSYRGFEAVSTEAILANLTKVKEEGKPNVFASDRVIMPLRGTKHSAGYDIFNPIPQDIVIPPNKKVLIWTNIKVFMQEEEVLMAVVRSSMGIKLDLTLANTLGIIDMDYYNNPKNEGNIGICLKNTGDEDVIIKYGDAIGQVIFLPYLVSDNCNTDKDRVGGIGSTTEIIKGEI